MSVTAVVGQTPKCCPVADEGRVDPGGCEVDPGDDGADVFGAVVVFGDAVGDVAADAVLGADAVLAVGSALKVGAALKVGGALEVDTPLDVGAVLDPGASGAGVEPQPATSTRRATAIAIGPRSVIGVTPCPPMVRPALRRPARIVGPVT